MSIDSEQGTSDKEVAWIAQLSEFDTDALTNHLVEALYEAFRILHDEVAGETLH